jgi:Protein of unknown function (DUF669)
MSDGDWIEDEKTTDSGEAMFTELFGDGGFDPNKVKSSLLPAGVYRLRISKVETRASKAGPNMLAFTLVVAEPSDYEGRRVYENINLQHASAQVRQIAQQQLKAICLACGVTQAKRPSDLVDRECVATVAIKTEKSGELRNNVKKYHDASKEVPAVFVEAAGGDGGDAFGM